MSRQPNPRLALLCSESANRVDGIRDYSVAMVAAVLRGGRARPDLLLRTPTGAWVAAPAVRADTPTLESSELQGRLTDYDAIVLQYNPFMYGRWGIAPWLPLALWNLTRGNPHPKTAIMVHEPYVPMLGWRWRLMGAYQRIQLITLRRCVDVAFASTESWARAMDGGVSRGRSHHLPVASNLPNCRRFRSSERERMKLGADDLVVAVFGTDHPSRLAEYIVGSSNALARSGYRVLLLNLGAGAPLLRGLDARVRVHSPGILLPDALARCLATADLFLAPFIDGVSTRRTTVMAALQHGLAVVATEGPLTDTVWRNASGALRLVPVGQPDRFSQVVVELAGQPEKRRALGDQASTLYAKVFDWPVLADRLLDGLGVAA